MAWRELFDASLLARHGLGIDDLVDGEDAVIAAFVEGLIPEEAAELDAIDLALALWRRQLSESTRATYSGVMRRNSRELGFKTRRPVRAALAAAVRNARSFATMLEGFAGASTLKSGGIRGRIIAWSSAVEALVRAKLAPQLLRAKMPARDIDADVEPSSHRAILAADRHLVEQGTLVSARTLVVLHLATSGIKPGELAALNYEDLDLETSQLRIRRSVVGFGAAAKLALETWISHRGQMPGPLLAAVDRSMERVTSRRVTPRSLERAIAAAGAAIGEPLTMQSLRRRPVVDAETTRDAHRVARTANPWDVYRFRSPRKRRLAAQG